MTSIVQQLDYPVVMSRALAVPEFNMATFGETLSIERLPTEPLGTMTLTLTNVVIGSRYRIERQVSGSLATPTANAEGVAAGTTVAITLDYYVTGSANNDLKIKARKASSAPSYKPFETQTTIGAQDQSIFVGQIADE